MPRRLCCRICLLLLFALPLFALTPEQDIHADTLLKKVTARCCLNKSAVPKLRAEIRRFIQRGDNDEQILAVYAKRFGAEAAVLPDDSAVSPAVVVFWMLFPATVVSVGGFFVVRWRDSRRRAATE